MRYKNLIHTKTAFLASTQWMIGPVIVIFILLADKSWSQGCSDAGLCTIGASSHTPEPIAIKQDSTPTGVAVTLRTTVSVASGEQLAWNTQFISEPWIHLSPKLDWQLRFPFLYTNGNLGYTAGWGDISTSIIYKLRDNRKNAIAVSAGFRFPTGSTDLKYENEVLPMAYQTGLGTTDLLSAIALRFDRFRLALSGLVVLKHTNNNTFDAAAYAEGSNAAQYFSSNQLHRGNDVSIRTEYYFEKHKKWLAPGIIFIYRLNGDTYRNEKNERVKIKDSAGASFNFTLTGYFETSSRSAWQAQLGVPFIVRHARPDGTTRTATLNFTYIYRWKHK